MSEFFLMCTSVAAVTKSCDPGSSRTLGRIVLFLVTAPGVCGRTGLKGGVTLCDSHELPTRIALFVRGIEPHWSSVWANEH